VPLDRSELQRVMGCAAPFRIVYSVKLWQCHHFSTNTLVTISRPSDRADPAADAQPWALADAARVTLLARRWHGGPPPELADGLAVIAHVWPAADVDCQAGWLDAEVPSTAVYFALVVR
jgi:hypothetical protein